MDREGKDITLHWEFKGDSFDFSFIDGDTVTELTKELNDALIEDGDTPFTPEQVKCAVWVYVKDRIDALREGLHDQFMNQSSRNICRYLKAASKVEA